MPSLGPWELGIILLIVIVIFGAGKLPEIGSSLGKSIRGFKAEVTDASKEEQEKAEAVRVDTKPSTTADLKTETRPTPAAKDEAVR